MARLAASGGQARMGAGCLGLFFGLFGLVGATLFYVLGVRPVLRAYAARSWVERPARIVTSTVERHRGSKGGYTYNVAMAFDYAYEGRSYRGTHYDFNTGSSSGLEGKQEVVDHFPAGSRTTCWVNPGNPAEAVIDRSIGSWILWGLFPLPFLGVGLGALVYAIAAASKPHVLGPGAAATTATTATTTTAGGAIAPS